MESKSNTFSIIDNLIWKMTLIWLIVDSITGFFISSGVDMPLSQLFKLLLLCFVIIRICKNKSAFISSYVLLIYISWYFVHLILLNENFVTPILTLLKFLTIFFLYAFFRIYCINSPLRIVSNVYNVMIVAWFIVAFNVLVGLMGYGVPSYGEDAKDMGVKGFFYAGNELSGIMAVLTPFMIYLVIVKLTGLKAILAYIAIVIIGISIGTKSSILVTLLSVIVVPALYMPPQKRLKVLFCLIAIIICLFSFLFNLISELSISAIDRWLYFYDTGGMEKLVYSGRDEFWKLQKEVFFKSDFITQLFGMGIQGKPVERDHLDSLLMFGYCGAFTIISFFLYLLFIALRYRHNNSLVKIVIFSDLLILGIGYMAGHVWFSGMASIYIALLNVLPFVHHEGLIFGKTDKISA